MKKIILFIALVIATSFTTGCLKSDTMDDIDIITTIYPIEYVANRLYSDYSTVRSIYPKDTIIKDYEITEKQISDFAKNDLLIYNGYGKEKEYAINMINLNNNLKIIDATYGISEKYKESDLWLNPANLLMIAQNIKNELTTYLSNNYIIDDMNNKYELFKVDMTELEANLKKTADNAQNKTIISSDETLKFLEKYGFEVIALFEEDESGTNQLNAENLEEANELLEDKKVNYIFITDNETESSTVKNLRDTYDIDALVFRTMETITEKDVSNNEDYLTIMNYNIELLKEETYN